MKSAVARTTSSRKIGRPLSFDRDAALEQAMLSFWKHGYETTSISDLTEAMGITAPSLYTAFGNKQLLFLEAARRYAGDPETTARAIEQAPTAYDAARALLIGSVTVFTGASTPPGCLLASATASGSVASAEVQAAIAEIRKTTVQFLSARIERDIADGQLPGSTNAAALATLIMTIIQGLSVLARDGSSRASLLAVVEIGLQAWPKCQTDGVSSQMAVEATLSIDAVQALATTDLMGHQGTAGRTSSLRPAPAAPAMPIAV